ncbi:MAG TPA: glycosyltransferase family 39 protein [Gemmatimonadaceae bacterium]|nr:glycosyltransferase family 39 protein [Gemmatimonadaceae bacterium]
MQIISFASGPLAFATILFVSSYVIGRRITWPLRYDSVWEEIGISSALGLGTVAYVIFVLGMAGALYPQVILPVLVLLLLLCYPVLRTVASRVTALLRGPARPGLRALVVSAIVIVALAPGFLLSLFPPTGDVHDSISYHLPLASTYVEAHRVVLAPYLRYPTSPQANQMLFTLALLFTSEIGAHLVQFLMMILTAVLLYAWAVRIFSVSVALWAAALWLATPMVIRLGASAYIDIGLSLFVTAGAYALFRWLSTRTTAWLVLAGVFSGFAAGSKYSALFFVVAYGSVALYVAPRDQRKSLGFVFLVIAVGVAAPWYLRNFYYTGDPLFPTFGAVLGYTLWSPADVQGQVADWRSRSLTGPGFELAELLKLAFPVLLLLPVTLYQGIRQPGVRPILLLVLAYTAFWLSGASLPRYLLPVWPLLALAAAASLGVVVGHRFVSGRFWRPAVTIVLAVMLLMPGWLFASASVYRRWPLPTNDTMRDRYLAQRLETYPIYSYLNRERGEDYTLYALYDGRMAYYADGTFMGNYFGPARYRDLLDSMTSGETLFRHLKRLGATHFLVASRYPVELPRDQFFETNFKPVFAGSHGVLFELGDNSDAVVRGGGPLLVR